jgi:hypothetical protein
MAAPSLTEFRSTFPEFAPDDLYSDGQVNLWLTFALQMANEQRWGTLYSLGVYLVTAHNLYLSARDQATAEAGGVPGEVTGSVSSKAVDKVSVSYDTGAVAMEKAGDWALSTYGIRYLRMARLMGAGGLQL